MPQSHCEYHITRFYAGCPFLAIIIFRSFSVFSLSLFLVPSGNETSDFTVQLHKLLLYSMHPTLSRLILIRLDAGLRVVLIVSLYIHSYLITPFYFFEPDIFSLICSSPTIYSPSPFSPYSSTTYAHVSPTLSP